MSDALEHSYERALRMYPSAWRERNGQVVIGTLLDMASAQGRTTPTLAERVDLAINGILLRLGIFLPATVRDGVTTVALSTGAAFALVYFWFSGWAPLAVDRNIQLELYSFGPFMNPGVILCAAWIVALTCALLAWNRASRVALTASILIAVVIPWTNRLVPEWNGPSSTNLGFLVILALLALSGSPRSRPRLTLAFATWIVTFVGLGAANGMLTHQWDRLFWVWIANPTNLPIAAIIVLLVAAFLFVAGRRVGATVVLGSFLPWAAVWGIGIMNDDPLAALALAVAGLTIIPLVIAGIFVARNQRRALTDSTTPQGNSEH